MNISSKKLAIEDALLMLYISMIQLIREQKNPRSQKNRRPCKSKIWR